MSPSLSWKDAPAETRSFGPSSLSHRADTSGHVVRPGPGAADPPVARSTRQNAGRGCLAREREVETAPRRFGVSDPSGRAAPWRDRRVRNNLGGVMGAGDVSWLRLRDLQAPRGGAVRPRHGRDGGLLLRCGRGCRAINELFRPVKLNEEIYGNTIPHLQLNLFPPFAGDPFGGGPIRGRNGRRCTRRTISSEWRRPQVGAERRLLTDRNPSPPACYEGSLSHDADATFQR
jgi:hypothetical protein